MTRPQSSVAVERTMMTPLRARRLAAHLRALRAIGILAVMAFATAARADAVDDTLAKFLDDKFPQTAAAIGELSAEAPPQAAAILEALADNRLLIDQADKIVAYKTAAGALLNAKTGEAIPDSSAAAFKKVRVNNALRGSIEGAMGSLTLANPDPEKRLAAAEDVYRTHDAKALPALQTQLAKESDPRIAAALKLAQASIFATSDNTSTQDRLSAIASLKERGDRVAARRARARVGCHGSRRVGRRRDRRVHDERRRRLRAVAVRRRDAHAPDRAERTGRRRDRGSRVRRGRDDPRDVVQRRAAPPRRLHLRCRAGAARV